jgi:hypothetical protein
LPQYWGGVGERDASLLLHNVGATTLRAVLIMGWMLVTEAEHRQRLERQRLQLCRTAKLISYFNRYNFNCVLQMEQRLRPSDCLRRLTRLNNEIIQESNSANDFSKGLQTI